MGEGNFEWVDVGSGSHDICAGGYETHGLVDKNGLDCGCHRCVELKLEMRSFSCDLEEIRVLISVQVEISSSGPRDGVTGHSPINTIFRRNTNYVEALSRYMEVEHCR